MKENIHDRVVNKLLERNVRVRAKLTERYKKTKPFRQEPMDNNELLLYYNMLNSDDMDFLVQKHGEDTVNTFIFEMETLKGGK